MTIEKRGRAFAVVHEGELLVLCVYKRGARAVIAHIEVLESEIAMRVGQLQTLEHQVAGLTRDLHDARRSRQLTLFG